jgi:hypothetical protein
VHTVLLANMRFLAGYRRPGIPPDEVATAVLVEARSWPTWVSWRSDRIGCGGAMVARASRPGIGFFTEAGIRIHTEFIRAAPGRPQGGDVMSVPSADTDELASFGYKQELDRSLGLFSSFAAGFSYISIMTGVFELFPGRSVMST